MARQQNKLPARRRNALDESLLIRSAESLGRVIGTLQRQLDAARRLVDSDQRGNGHAPARQRSGVTAKRSGVSKERRQGVSVDSKVRRQGVPADTAKPATKAKSAGKTRAAKKR